MDQIINSYMDTWRNWNNFSGRTRRSGYWYAVLANAVISLLLSILADLAGIFSVVSVLYSLAYLVPGLALTVRRLHDTGHSAWWLLVCLVPAVLGSVAAVVIVLATGMVLMGASGSVGLFALAALLGIACLVCAVFSLILLVKDSGPDNRYGPNPKGMFWGTGAPQPGYQYQPPREGPGYGPEL